MLRTFAPKINEQDKIYIFNGCIDGMFSSNKATLYEKWFAELDLDFAFNEVALKDIYMGYKFNDHWNVKFGHFKVPMSMERLTSSKYITAAERPMPVEAFADGRRLGIAGTGWGKGWFGSAGVFLSKAASCSLMTQSFM